MRIIYTDEFDEGAWQEALALSRVLRELHMEGGQRHSVFEELLADTFQLLYQPSPSWTAPQHPTLHELLLRQTEELREFRELKALSSADAVNATLACGILGRQTLKRLGGEVEEHLIRENELLYAAHQAAEELGALDELAGMGEAVNGLDEAKDAARHAQAVAAKAIQELGTSAAIEQAAGKLRREMRQAARSATEELERLHEAEVLLGGAPTGSMEAKLELAERLSRSTKLAQLVEVAGRIRRIALHKRASLIREARGEIVGVTMGTDVGRAVPSELALLASPATRLLFLRKFVEGQLMLHEEQGEERLGGGPIILLVDGSGSMVGEKEVWSKAVTLAFLAVAERERRDLLLCQFGGPGERRVWEFPYRSRPGAVYRSKALEAVEVFLAASSTDLEGPLLWAARQIEQGRPEKLGAADIVVLTDAECRFSPEFLAAWNRKRERLGFQTFGVLIGAAGFAEVLAQAIENVTHVADLAVDEDKVLSALFGR